MVGILLLTGSPFSYLRSDYTSLKPLTSLLLLFYSSQTDITFNQLHTISFSIRLPLPPFPTLSSHLSFSIISSR